MGTVRMDPLGAYNFTLTLLDSSAMTGGLTLVAGNYVVAGFSECTGMEASVEVMELKEGGVNTNTWKLPVRASYANITLKHGAVWEYDDLWDWHYGWVQGRGVRKDGLITLNDNRGHAAKIWKFRNAIAMKWTGPTLNATQSAVAIESLEIAHEGLELELGD
jgi:phage tail-like protein